VFLSQTLNKQLLVEIEGLELSRKECRLGRSILVLEHPMVYHSSALRVSTVQLRGTGRESVKRRRGRRRRKEERQSEWGKELTLGLMGDLVLVL